MRPKLEDRFETVAVRQVQVSEDGFERRPRAPES
jgi:hypothetical protein